jgi:hypothetical protein
VELMLKMLGLDVCADTIVGSAMIRGISGGQKKRVTTGAHLACGGATELKDPLNLLVCAVLAFSDL